MKKWIWLLALTGGYGKTASRAFARADGEWEWDAQLPSPANTTRSNLVATKTLVMIELGGTVYGVNITTGAVEWASPLLQLVGEPEGASITLSACPDALLAVVDTGTAAALTLAGEQAGTMLWAGSSTLLDGVVTWGGLAFLPGASEIQAVWLDDGAAAFAVTLPSEPVKVLVDEGVLLALLEDGTLQVGEPGTILTRSWDCVGVLLR